MTIRQKQLLLAYFGYYEGAIDGIWGSQSEAATKAFQKTCMETSNGIFDAATEQRIREAIGKEPAQNDFWQGIRWFDRKEFACKCGRCGGFPAEPEETLVRIADRLREEGKTPITVSSGVRCQAHNAAVGGVSNSRHLSGKAMDFCMAGKTAEEILAMVRKQSEIRYAYAIGHRYVHMDIA